jgi:hypothetical protein
MRVLVIGALLFALDAIIEGDTGRIVGSNLHSAVSAHAD